MATFMCAITIAAPALMPAGSGLTVPRQDRIPLDYQLWQGEQTAARVASTLLRAGIADAEDWLSAKRNPLYFLKGALDRWLSRFRPGTSSSVRPSAFWIESIPGFPPHFFTFFSGRSIDGFGSTTIEMLWIGLSD